LGLIFQSQQKETAMAGCKGKKGKGGGGKK